MKVTPTRIPEVLLIEPKMFGDARGFFYESFNGLAFAKATGLHLQFVQDNHSKSAYGVLRGLHYQIQQPQGKLVRVVAGEVFDVAVDLRRSSATFGQWVGAELSAKNGNQLWIPPGFAHGFCTLTHDTVINYKVTSYYSAEHDKGLAWNDPALSIIWPPEADPETLSAKDRLQPRLADLPPYFSIEV